MTTSLLPRFLRPWASSEATPAEGPAAAPLGRRQALAGAGTVGALAAVAAVLPMSRDEPAAGAAPADGATDADGRYQVTQHVLRYYQTTRI